MAADSADFFAPQRRRLHHPPTTGPDVFVHISAITSGGSLQDGQKVSYDVSSTGGEMVSVIDRYALRQEQDETWTVFDTTAPTGRESRMMVRLSKERAQQYQERLNGAFLLASSALVKQQ